MFEEPGLRDKVALITGGSRGIGRELVRRFAEEGCEVAFLYLKEERAAEEVCRECAARGRPPLARRADVRDRQTCEKAVAEIVDRWGRIDVLVNNSAVIRDNLLAFFSEEEVRTVLDTNVVGA